MKKSILTAIVTLVMFTATAQKVSITKVIDKMEDEPYYFASRDMVVSNASKTEGARLTAFIDEKDSIIYVRTLSVTMVNIGSNCVEDNELVILFDNDTKIVLKSWNKFNCDGNAWFEVSADDIQALSTLKMNKIKLTNGRTFDSFTTIVAPKDKSYFIELLSAVNSNKFKIVNK